MIFDSLKSIKTSVDLIEKHAQAKAFKEFETEIVNLRKVCLDAYSLALDFQERFKEMKEKLDQAEDWATNTVPYYSLYEFAPGVIVYAFEPVGESKEPRHYICPYCYDEKRKSILQRTGRDTSGVHMKCHKCGADFIDHTDRDSVTVEIV